MRRHKLGSHRFAAACGGCFFLALVLVKGSNCLVAHGPAIERVRAGGEGGLRGRGRVERVS